MVVVVNLKKDCSDPKVEHATLSTSGRSLMITRGLHRLPGERQPVCKQPLSVSFPRTLNHSQSEDVQIIAIKFENADRFPTYCYPSELVKCNPFRQQQTGNGCRPIPFFQSSAFKGDKIIKLFAHDWQNSGHSSLQLVLLPNVA